jgi:hypothetical protein
MSNPIPKKLSELTSAITVANDDLIEISQADNDSYISKKATIELLLKETSECSPSLKA